MTEIYARPLPKTKATEGSKRKVSEVAKVQGEGSQRRYPEKVKSAIAKMATERGDRSSAKYFSKELGFEVHPITVKRFKKAFPCNQKKKRGEEQEEGENSQDDEEEEHIEVEEEQVNRGDSNTQLQVQQVNTNQEQEEIIIVTNEEVNGKDDEIQEQVNTGESSITNNQENLNQVKEQRIEGEEDDEDLIVRFDSRGAYKETPAIAIMKKYVELERKIQMRKKEAQLLQMKKEELSKKLAEELAK